MGRLLLLWRSFSRVDRAACVLVVLVCACAFLTWPVVSKLFPEVAVIASWSHSSEEDRVDPWQRPFVVKARGLTYSVGRNGIDDLGSGDDVILFDTAGTRGQPGRVHAGALLLSQSLGFFLLLAAFLAGTYYSARRGPPARNLRKELTRSLMLSVPIGVLAATMSFLASYTVITDKIRADLASAMILSPTVALIGSIFAVTFLAILCVRLVHSKEGLVFGEPPPPRPQTIEEAAKDWLPELG